MREKSLVFCLQILVVLSCLLPATAFVDAATIHTAGITTQKLDQLDFPVVDPNYIYDQLFTLATRFQGREAGYTTAARGHQGFADYWAQEMLRDLQGFGATVRRDNFAVQGWQGRPANTPAFNVEVSVPGATHPEQFVVIGCHYDGEAVSTQSANDDTSGCAIELGVAKALGEYWRNHRAYPARTLRFVIFDAEEQGLLGSFHYANDTVNGDLRNIVAMFNEEQNGIAYPLRYLGRLKNPLMPFYIEMTPLQASSLYPNQGKLTQEQKDRITRFRDLMQQAIPLVFQKFQELGYRGLTYHGQNRQDVPQPVFSSNDLSYVHAEDDVLGSSDQIPFTLAGIACATFVGNSTYYDANPPPGSYPFDQHDDTIQLMNTFADGSSKQSNALMLALALPGMLTTWMLNQSDVLGQTAASQLSPGVPLAAIGDIARIQSGQKVTFDANAAFIPHVDAANLHYNWDFGDGTRDSGVTVEHTYTSPGTYTLKVTVASATGQI
ncbi:MAG TPA: M28 family peptidase, partial [Ktedonobacteraceae bacterium]|nr:M28 family peptidase [Ktedonobacteraceae bacterium]